MNATFRPYLLAFMLLLGGCVSGGLGGDRQLSEVYEMGSTIGGGRYSLALYSDGTWESGFTTCTSHRRAGRGHYQKNEDAVILYTGSKPVHTFRVYSQGRDSYLVSEEKWQALKNDSTRLNPYAELMKGVIVPDSSID